MDVHPDCVPCLMKRVLFQARLVGNGTEFDAVEAALKTYAANIGSGVNSARLATMVHASAYKAMGVADPYLDLKVRADEVAGRYLARMEDEIDSSEDRLSTAIRVSIIGNIMDFGSGIAIDDPDEFEKEFDSLLRQGVDPVQTGELVKAIVSSKNVMYVFDNCGESQFDKLLIREIKALGIRVVGVVRGKPILNDVTISDAVRIGLDKELDLLIDTGVFSIGADLHNCSPEFREELGKTDLMIMKGMANYEATSSESIPVCTAHLLRAKCIPVSDSLGVKVGDNVVFVRKP